ncbi:cytokinin dehydrogenase 6-like [Curcuma longa]|uniref:cytokinin dehydrogenase 6-like n=1 Tax=Curcuma longa TaxID=136217 RepID=UPI003D9F3266
MAAGTSSWLDDIAPEILSKLHSDGDTVARFAADYGSITNDAPPAAVLRPSSPEDIAALIRCANGAKSPFSIAARGNGHSAHGQAFAPGGVVIDMAELRGGSGQRIRVSAEESYVDAGGEQLWIDVLEETLRHGLSMRSWVDYLYLTVGGTLSNAGVGGMVFRHGPLVSSVLELDVITGKGEMITCSPELNSDLFYGVLGGLGQLGVISRARISLCPTPAKVRWLRLFYTDFDNLIRDQEFLISLRDTTGFDFVEGQVLLNHQQVDDPNFFSIEEAEKINQLTAEFNAVYLLEGAVLFDSTSVVDQKVEGLLKQLNFVPSFAFSKDVGHLEFLNRVYVEEEHRKSSMAVDPSQIRHPWLNLFVPKSRIRDFQTGTEGILQNINPTGVVLLYPMNRNRWNENMTVVFPEEEVFYTVEFLWTSTEEDWKKLDACNNEILEFCHRQGIQAKQYLANYTSQTDWMEHFGEVKWEKFLQLKQTYDPKALLSPGQHIFTK